MKRWPVQRLLTPIIISLAFLANEAFAFTGNTWNPQGTAGGAPTSGNWEDVSWSQSTTEAAQSPTAAFVEGEAACFAVGNAASTNTSLVITMNGNHSVAGLFNGPLAPASCILTINGPGIMSMPTSSLQGIDTAGTTPGVTIINATIAGTAIVTPEGTGQLFLNGSNTYTGGTSMGWSGTSFTGTLNFSNSASFGTGTITISNASGCGMVAEPTTAFTIPNPVAWQQASAHVNIVGNSAGVTFSGAWNLVNSAGIGSGGSTASQVILAGAISGAGGINKYNPGILKLSGTNTYTGATVISNGTFALGVTGSINSSPSITILPGANASIFDVSAISSYVLGTGSSLIAMGTGTAATTSATIKGASGGSVSLGNRPVTLNFTPTVFTGDTTHPPLVVSQGTLVLSNNVFTVTNAAATALGVGTYRLVQVGNGTTGVISGSPNPAPLIRGTGIATNLTALLSVSNGNVILRVRPISSFSALSISQLNLTGIGATNVTISGRLSSGALVPASGEAIGATVNGTSDSTAINDTNGDFAFSFNPSTINYSPTNYPVVLTYGGDNALSPLTATNNIAANTLFVDDSLPGFFSGLNIFFTNTAGIPAYTWSTTNPAAPVTDWTLEGSMFEQPFNDGSGKSRYTINVTPATSLVYYVSGPTNGWPYASPAGAQWIVTDSGGNYTYFTTNISMSPAGVMSFPSAPVFVVQPANAGAFAGRNVTFSAVATGSQPMFYQWFFNTNTPVSAQITNFTFTLGSVTTNQAGLYSVVASNQLGSVTSSFGSLSVLPLPVLAGAGTTNGFQITATGPAGSIYRVEMATNISPPVAWKPVLTNTTDTNGLAQFIDTNQTALPGRFYRIVFP